jgi:hypothetical protein
MHMKGHPKTKYWDHYICCETTILYSSQRKGLIVTSNYGAEFYHEDMS